MTRNPSFRTYLLAGLISSAGFVGVSCSGNKKEANTKTETAAGDSSVFGRQGDTTTNTLNAPEQAPPDSASASGAVVPAEVKVTPKK